MYIEIRVLFYVVQNMSSRPSVQNQNSASAPIIGEDTIQHMIHIGPKREEADQAAAPPDAKRLREKQKEITLPATLTPEEALMFAAEFGRKDIVEWLIEKAGADVNAKDRYGGWTALEKAARYGHTEIVTLLIKAGADVNFKDEDGWTVLEKAAEEGYTKIVQLLIEAGADV